MTTIVLRRAARPARTVTTTDLFAALGAGPMAAPAPPVQLESRGEDGVLTVEAPGLDPAADLSVRVTGRTLTVAGIRRQSNGTRRGEARFSRSVTLPEGLGGDAVSADYSAGVLRVRVVGMFPAPVVPVSVDVAIASDVRSAAADPQPDSTDAAVVVPEATVPAGQDDTDQPAA